MSEINDSLLSRRSVRVRAENPEKILDSAVNIFTASTHAQQLLAVDFDFLEYWRSEPSIQTLVALYHLQKIDNDVAIVAAIIDSSLLTAGRWQQLENGSLSFADCLQELQAPGFNLQRALLLQPITIPKPWGCEIWYTGIEQRGVAEISDGVFSVALPWLLALAPRRLLGERKELILLKILDPLPQAVFGDLYFEMHQRKQEVYVVTAVDATAWPEGKGAIRFGFNNELRAQYDDDQRFISDYLAAVRAYRTLRKSIDQQLDNKRAAAGIDLVEPLAATTLQHWLAELPVALSQQEQTLRAAMERFTGMQPLAVGDVVKVPCLVPHSLQHGVRTVEFQTPVYERLILSFAQKVLTQSEWDTDAAASLLCMDPPPIEPFAVTAQGAGWLEQRIVEFDDFEVRRVTLQAQATRALSAAPDYSLLMVVGAGVQLDGVALAPDSAYLLPAHWCGGDLKNIGGEPAYLLLATPIAARG